MVPRKGKTEANPDSPLGQARGQDLLVTGIRGEPPKVGIPKRDPAWLSPAGQGRRRVLQSGTQV